MARKAEKERVRCMDCKLCDLLLYEKNGVVIADCLPRKEREVANAPRLCDLFEKGTANKEITKLYELF